MAAISQTTLSNALSWMKMLEWIAIKISLKFVHKGPINNIPALVQIMAWRRPGYKPLSEPIVGSLLTHICVTRPQRVLSNAMGGSLDLSNWDYAWTFVGWSIFFGVDDIPGWYLYILWVYFMLFCFHHESCLYIITLHYTFSTSLNLYTNQLAKCVFVKRLWIKVILLSYFIFWNGLLIWYSSVVPL